MEGAYGSQHSPVSRSDASTEDAELSAALAHQHHLAMQVSHVHTMIPQWVTLFDLWRHLHRQNVHYASHWRHAQFYITQALFTAQIPVTDKTLVWSGHLPFSIETEWTAPKPQALFWSACENEEWMNIVWNRHQNSGIYSCSWIIHGFKTIGSRTWPFLYCYLVDTLCCFQ